MSMPIIEQLKLIKDRLSSMSDSELLEIVGHVSPEAAKRFALLEVIIRQDEAKLAAVMPASSRAVGLK